MTEIKMVTLRKLNTLVAEKVMGWSDIGPQGYHTYCGRPPGERFPIHDLPRYSTDIAAAWEVVEKVGGMTLGTHPDWPNGPCWTAYVGEGSNSSAKTAPLAICLAALKAKGINVEVSE